MMKDEIVEYITKNKFRLRAEIAVLGREKEEVLKREPKDFHEIVNSQFLEKLRGHVIRDLSMNLGIDYETSMIELEQIDLEKALA